MSEDDLKPPAELSEAAKEFPESLPLENSALPLNYAYKPGKEDDFSLYRVPVGRRPERKELRLGRQSGHWQ